MRVSRTMIYNLISLLRIYTVFLFKRTLVGVTHTRPFFANEPKHYMKYILIYSSSLAFVSTLDNASSTI